jgi:hypothetical protein
MSPKHQARLTMEAVALLHQRGCGRLKLYCYIKEGLGAWRHWVFASDEFPDDVVTWAGPKSHGSLPGQESFHGFTVEEVAESILAQCPDVAEAARGQDESYVVWYREMLAAHPDGVLEMESPLRASILGYGEVKVPELKAWMRPPRTQMSAEQLAVAQEAQQLRIVERARHQRLKGRRSR